MFHDEKVMMKLNFKYKSPEVLQHSRKPLECQVSSCDKQRVPSDIGWICNGVGERHDYTSIITAFGCTRLHIE
mgnify:CR=1 FL=1